MSTTIIEYSSTDAALALLSERYRGATYDVATASGMTEARKARGELRGYRVDLEKKRVEIKAPALDRCRAIDSEAKRITAALAALEDPIDAQIKTEENRKAEEKAAAERAETVRVEKIAARVADLERWPLALVGRTAAQITQAVSAFDKIAITEPDFGERTEEALALRGRVLVQLTEMHRAAVVAETERAELARLKAEQAERERTEQARVEAENERQRLAIEDMDRRAAEARQAIEVQERAARERIEIAELSARAERDRADKAALNARLAEQSRLDFERENIEAEKRAIEDIERETRRRQCAVLDARAILEKFLECYGKLPEFAKVTKAIEAYLCAVAEDRTAAGAKEAQAS